VLAVLVVLSIFGLAVAWQWFLYKKSGRSPWNPLWMAFTATAAAILFLVAGAAGYQLSHGVPFTVRSAWTDRVIWSQIWAGAGIALVAVFLWRRGLRSI
jgi:hypothetical protein